MIALTQDAATKIETLLADRPNITGIKVGIQGGGCSGFTYRLDFAEGPDPKDHIYESEGVQLYVDPKSFLYLMGTSINYVDSLAGAGFKFENPSARRTCGCGESFSV